MKTILSEKGIVVILFLMVLVIFSLAKEDTKKMEKLYIGATATGTAGLLVQQPAIKKTGHNINTSLHAVTAE